MGSIRDHIDSNWIEYNSPKKNHSIKNKKESTKNSKTDFISFYTLQEIHKHKTM